MTGVLVLDKPAGFTSFDAVAVLRGLCGERKIGHTGTLDPMATGVLPMLLGRATRALPLLADRPKTYEAAFRFGYATDTLDRTGKTVCEDQVPVSEERLLNAVPRFHGELLQTPPMYSAVRQNGVRLYDLARQGKEVERAPRRVTIYDLKILSYDEKSRQGTLYLTCSGGTYVRVLIADLAAALGTHGVMTALRRTQAAGFTLEEACTLDALRAMPPAERLSQILPVERLFLDLPAVCVSKAQAKRFLNGGALDCKRLAKRPAARCRVQDPDGRFLGIGEPKADELRVVRLFLSPEEEDA